MICKVAGKAKSSIGIPQACESIGAAMCNPILQARLLNEARTDLNVVIGLCVGHDSLFYKYSEAYATTLVTKDRGDGQQPCRRALHGGVVLSEEIRLGAVVPHAHDIGQRPTDGDGPPDARIAHLGQRSQQIGQQHARA